MQLLPRILFSLLAGSAIAMLLLWTMQWMVLQKTLELQAERQRPVMEFVRLKHDSETRIRERRELEPEPEPEDKPPPRPELQPLEIDRPALKAPPMNFKAPNLPLALSGPFMGSVRQGPPDRDFMVISQVPPQYPYRAQRRGIEGWVRVSMLITEQGLVQDAVVVEAQPEGIFDQAALNAVLKWKFKPRIENGKAVAVRAQQTVNFNLQK